MRLDGQSIVLMALGLAVGAAIRLGMRPLTQWLSRLAEAPVALPVYMVEKHGLTVVHGLVWLACSQHWPQAESAIAWAIFGSLLLTLALVDGHTTWLPDVLTQPLLWAGLVASLLAWIDTPLDLAVTGAMVGYGFLRLTSLLFERLTGQVGMGGGDVKLLAALGAWLGPWALVQVLLIASTSGALVGLAMQQKRRLKHDGSLPPGHVAAQYLPFGPFLALAGAFVAWSKSVDGLWTVMGA